ncbi:uncharacterized protein (DUF58 family) [Salsuginibacillus halophilus]|uniref:Uncharacterized protein (DUF58 family) n=1 Tax=Salsuginibacillus halophilus TaxID=517424 RepID=A0A2P8HG65_9BACI|nr:DUF58 domain-containing protein [Salsuginibacillus halophilus]PSL45205.1 uncharacterized protein (DUF58 family) [Salsuginibacillus halophilus]
MYFKRLKFRQKRKEPSENFQIRYVPRFQWLVYTAPLLLLLGYLFSLLPVILAGLSGLLFVGWTNLYFWWMNKHLQVISFDQAQWYFPNDAGKLAIQVKNPGMLPVWEAEVRIRVHNTSRAVAFEDGSPQSDEQTFPLVLGPKAVKEIHLPFTTVKRGTADLRAVELTLTDPLRFGKVTKTFYPKATTNLCVYPTLSMPAPPAEAARQHPGSELVPFTPFENRLEPSGTRDYTYGDNVRNIDWRATARMQHTQVRTFETEQYQMWTIILHLNETSSQNFETQVQYAVWYMMRAEEKQIPFSLYINLQYPQSQGVVSLLHKEGASGLREGMQLLAKIRAQAVITPLWKTYAFIKQRDVIPPVLIHIGPSGEDLPSYQVWQAQGTVVTKTAPDMHERQGAQWSV